jgi:hypothetical protein
LFIKVISVSKIKMSGMNMERQQLQLQEQRHPQQPLQQHQQQLQQAVLSDFANQLYAMEKELRDLLLAEQEASSSYQCPNP